jgi:hypothetical protein
MCLDPLTIANGNFDEEGFCSEEAAGGVKATRILMAILFAEPKGINLRAPLS